MKAKKKEKKESKKAKKLAKQIKKLEDEVERRKRQMNGEVQDPLSAIVFVLKIGSTVQQNKK